MSGTCPLRVAGKPCLQHTARVIDYLARYTRRIAISNARVLQIDSQTVTLSYKNYRHDARLRCMTLAGDELVRRFLLHILPKGLMRVRHYGFLANRCRRVRLGQIRKALENPSTENDSACAPVMTTAVPAPCPQCQRTTLRCIAIFAPRTVSDSGRMRRR